MKTYLIIFLCLFTGSLQAQTDIYDQLKVDYDRLRKEEKQDSALAIAKQMNAWALKNETDTSLRYAVSYRYMANCFFKINSGDSTLYYLDKSLEILEKQNRLSSIDASRCYSNKGIYFNSIYEEDLALLNYLEASKIQRDLLGEDNLEYAASIEKIGMLYYDLFEYEKAEPYFKSTSDFKKKKFGENHKDYAKSLNKLGLLYTNLKDIKNAELYFNSALDIFRNNLVQEYSEMAKVLINLGKLHWKNYNYKVAENYYNQAIEIRRKVSGENDAAYINVIKELGEMYAENRDYKRAEVQYQRVLLLELELFREQNIDVANTLISLGNLSWDQEDFDSGELYYKRALEIRMALLSKSKEIKGNYSYNDVLHNRAISNLQSFYYFLGRYKALEDLFKYNLDFVKIQRGCDEPEYASALNNMGVFYWRIGNYKIAENMFKEALGIYQKKYGMEHLDRAKVLNNMGNLYLDLGNFKLAESLYYESSVVIKEKLGVAFPDYAVSIMNRGIANFMLGEFPQTELLFKEALALKIKHGSKKNLSEAHSLNNLGIFYQELEEFKLAESFTKESIEIKRNILGAYHIDYGLSLMNLSNLYSEMKEYNSAEALCLEFLEIIKKSEFWESSPFYPKVLQDIGSMYSKWGKYESAFAYFSQALTLGQVKLLNNFSWMSSQERMLHWAQQSSFYLVLNSFANYSIDVIALSAGLAYNANLSSKSLLLETSRELDQAISQSADSTLKSQFTEMKQLRRAYNKMQSEGSDKREIMDRYNLKADSLDKILVNKLGEYAASKRKFEITWKDVQSNLSTDEAAIEYARYFDDNDSVYKYMALVVRPGYEYPKLVKLGKEEDIRMANQPKAQDFSALYDLVWQATDSLLSGVKTIYYSPSGELNNISFNALCFEVSDSLFVTAGSAKRGDELETADTSSRSCNSALIDKYTLHQLTTTRYLADGTLKMNRPLNSTITLAGGINYDDIPATEENIHREESEEDFALNVNLINRGSKKIGQRDGNGIGLPKDYLKGTKEEVMQISNHLNGIWSVQTYGGSGASENVLKMQLEKESPGVLHIATHGFAFPDAEGNDSQQPFNDERPSFNISEDPMVRCGLMLSGSNISWTGNPKKMLEQTGEDGILTAAEVSNMDLSKTKLVVLSACETGLGKIEGSEGTFGLKRGFKLAGVEQLIVSLWEVPDKETMELMTLFYSDLAKTLNPVISFEKAQKEMRNKYPTEPEKWAGFVLVR